MSETVEQFLARGGKINTLAMGYTVFPDGNIPMRPKPRKSEIKETPSDVIQDRNKAIRKYSPRPKIADEKSKLQIDEQVEMLGEFFGKMFRGDKKRFCELVGLSPKTFDNAKAGCNRLGADKWREAKLIMRDFVFSKPKSKQRSSLEADRRKQIMEAREKAKANGDTVFMAPCKHHGMTKFYLHGDQLPRCATCRMNNTRKRRDVLKNDDQKSKAERSKFNIEKMKDAVSRGLNVFSGLCGICGHAEMKYSKSPNTLNGYTYRCIECNRKNQALYKETRNKL